MADSEAVSQVRLLIADTSTTDRLFTDSQLCTFLDLEGDSVKLAAATALEVMARSEVMVGKVIKTQDLSTDGAKVSAELRAHAALLREQAGNDDDSAFDVLPYGTCDGPELAGGWRY